jgi:hypothetical protein
MGRKCIFCGELLTGNREKEHIIPRWLLEHMGIRDTELFLAVAKSDDNTIMESRTQAADEFVEGRVCGGCNSGWMSKLENESKGLLISLIEGTSSLLDEIQSVAENQLWPTGFSLSDDVREILRSQVSFFLTGLSGDEFAGWAALLKT